MENDPLSSLIAANLAACVAILAVLVLRRPARALLGARCAYALWLVVPVAMAASLLPARTIVVQAAAPAPALHAASTPPPIDIMAPVHAAAHAVTAAPLDLSRLALGLWLAGVAVFLILLVIGHRRAVAGFGRLTKDVGMLGVDRASNRSVGPALVGVFRPRVILPADFETRFAVGEQAMILAHEHTHAVSGHALINALVAVIKAVNWFNPLIHLAAHLAQVDQELACDASVVEWFPDERQSYAEALLKTQLATTALPLGCHWPVRSTGLLEERINMLALDMPGRLRLAAGAALIVALSAGAGLAAWAAQPPQVRIAQATPPAQSPPGAAQGAVDAALRAPGQPVVGVIVPPVPVITPVDGITPPPPPPPPARDHVQGTTDGFQPGTDHFCFQCNFNGDAPLLVKGKVTGIDWSGAQIQVLITDPSGKQFRVAGARVALQTPTMRTMYDATVGQDVIVQSYEAWDTACNSGCLVNGRVMTYADGSRVIDPAKLPPEEQN